MLLRPSATSLSSSSLSASFRCARLVVRPQLSPRRVLTTSSAVNCCKSPASSLAHARKRTKALQTLSRILPKLASSQQTRDHSGHGHGHHHHHGADPFLLSKDKTDPGVRITRIGLSVNLAMVVVKGAGGWAFNSQALIADAFHALTDTVSDLLTLSTVTFALKAPTDRFPNGYGKIESLGSLGVSSLLLFAGMGMCYNSLLHLIADFSPALLAYLPNMHSHSHEHGIPDWNAAWLALGSIGVKEWLYRKTMKVAEQRKSSVLASNAVHHRIDSLTAVVALVAVAGSNLFPFATWLDPVGGFMVSLLVMNAGYGNTRASLDELADTRFDEEVQEQVETAVKGVLEGAEELVDVEGLKSGQNYLVKVTVAVDGGRSVRECESAEERVREGVKSVRGVWRVGVRFVEKGGKGANEFLTVEKKLK